jgi:hypothetical protein
MFTNGLPPSTKFTKSIKTSTSDVALTNIFHNTCLIFFFALTSSWMQLFLKRYGLSNVPRSKFLKVYHLRQKKPSP